MRFVLLANAKILSRFRRLERAVNYVRKCHADPGNVPQYAHHMVSTLFNPLRMNATMPKRRVPITPFNETLNSTQIDAVEFALDAPGMSSCALH